MNEIRISGFGGQGIIRCGYIVGKTASLFDDKFATLTQSFGPEARGSACSAQVLVDKDPIRYPYLTVPDTVVCMSQEAYDKFGSHITEDGTLIIDEDLVKFDEPPRGGKLFSIPATRIAEQLGNRIVANIVMLGFFTAVTDILTVEAARKALPSSVPERFVDLNMKAFEQGCEYGLAVAGRLPEGDERPAPKRGPAKPKAAPKRAATKAKPKRAASTPKAKKKTAAKRAPAKAKPKAKRKTAAKRAPAKAKPKKAGVKAKPRKAGVKAKPKKAGVKAKPRKAGLKVKPKKASAKRKQTKPTAKRKAAPGARTKTKKLAAKAKKRSRPRARKK